MALYTIRTFGKSDWHTFAGAQKFNTHDPFIIDGSEIFTGNLGIEEANINHIIADNDGISIITDRNEYNWEFKFNGNWHFARKILKTLVDALIVCEGDFAYYCLVFGLKPAIGSIAVCPVCGKVYDTHVNPPALSRKDNKTEICSDCGVVEAFEDCFKFRRLF